MHTETSPLWIIITCTHQQQCETCFMKKMSIKTQIQYDFFLRDAMLAGSNNANWVSPGMDLFILTWTEMRILNIITDVDRTSRKQFVTKLLVTRGTNRYQMKDKDFYLSTDSLSFLYDLQCRLSCLETTAIQSHAFSRKLKDARNWAFFAEQ